MPSFFTGAESIAHRNDTPLLESRANAAPVVGGLACPPGAGGHASPRSKRNSKRPKCTHSAQAAPERAFRRTRGSPGSAPGAAGVGDGRGKGEEGGAEEQLSSSSLPLPPVRSASGRILFAAATRSGFPPRFRPLLRRERKGGGRPRGCAWPADPPAPGEERFRREKPLGSTGRRPRGCPRLPSAAAQPGGRHGRSMRVAPCESSEGRIGRCCRR